MVGIWSKTDNNVRRCLSCNRIASNSPDPSCLSDKHKSYYYKNCILYQRGKRDQQRHDIIKAYGGVCVCCGEDKIKFLTLSHMNNDGAAHKRALLGKRKGGSPFYKALKDAGYPKNCGIEVECYNCNCGKKDNGGVCPHKS